MIHKVMRAKQWWMGVSDMHVEVRGHRVIPQYVCLEEHRYSHQPKQLRLDKQNMDENWQKQLLVL